MCRVEEGVLLFTRVSLKVEVDQLTAELQLFNDLKKRVHESSFKRDLQRNIQVC